jgi:hypothetical protein
MSYPQQPGNQPDPQWSPPPTDQPGYGAAQPPFAGPVSDPYAPPAYPAGPGYQPAPAYPADPYAAQAQYQPYGYPTPPRQGNGLAIASLVLGILGILGLCGYGLGGYVGVVGAILGHVSRRQSRERGEAPDQMALAGVILGWIATGVAVLATIAIVVAIVWLNRSGDAATQY